MNQQYFKRVELLLSILPQVMQDERIALKGGTAINLFASDMPRFSIDIDLTYLPLEKREIALNEIDEIFRKIEGDLKKEGLITNLKLTAEKHFKQIIVEKERVLIKIEINHILRGTLHPTVIIPLVSKAEEKFLRSMNIRCLSEEDLYAGKICAALDRKHPRDLFDIYYYLKHKSYTRELHLSFLVYLISHNRPISELLRPSKVDLTETYTTEFLGMVEEDISIALLEKIFEKLVHLTLSSMTTKDKEFLLSFKRGDPQWDFLPFPHLPQLPAIQWKLYNIKKMNPTKHQEMIKNLEEKLKL